MKADKLKLLEEKVHLAIARGVRWLDHHYQGWEWKVDVDDLDMSDCFHCVLGQLTGSYRMAIAGPKPVINHLNALWYGFNLPEGTNANSPTMLQANATWDLLTRLWQRAIETRRRKGK